MEKRYKLLNGDCLDKLKELEDNSIDSIVTDPPYGLSFMGKKWDYDVPSQEIWEECIRVLKPGGHLLAFAGSRTYHRMAVRIEDAGFEIRDQIMWVYGSGFPKSHNIGKAVDKLQGKEVFVGKGFNVAGQGIGLNENKELRSDHPNYVKPKYDNEYEGWGTALKPAHEPIVMARKPFKGSVAENVLEYGVGGINVDGCRIGYEDTPNAATNPKYRLEGGYKTPEKGQESKGAVSFSSSNNDINPSGRFPANIIFECTCDNPIVKENTNQPYTYKDKNYSEQGFLPNVNAVAPYNYNDTNSGVAHTDPNCPCYILDEQSGTTKSSKRGAHNNKKTEHTNTYTPPNAMYSSNNTHGDTGGASRFFYCPKVSKKERNEGVEYTGQVLKGRDEGQDARANPYKLRPSVSQVYAANQTTSKIGANPNKPTEPRANIHPTVKPVELMTYLIRLVTPKDGIVLDPFMGSGSTGKAAMREGFQFVGIEREQEYMEIAEQRIDYEYNKRRFF